MERGFEKAELCGSVYTQKGGEIYPFHKMCGKGVLFLMFTFLCVLGISECMDNVWKGYYFHQYIPHDKGPFEFYRTSWLRNFSFETPPPPGTYQGVK